MTVNGQTFEATDVLCIGVPFSETMIYNASGTAPDGSYLSMYVTTDPDDIEVQLGTDSIDISLTPSLGDSLDLTATPDQLSGTATIVSGGDFVGETIVIEGTCP